MVLLIQYIHVFADLKHLPIIFSFLKTFLCDLSSGKKKKLHFKFMVLQLQHILVSADITHLPTIFNFFEKLVFVIFPLRRIKS